MSGNQRGPSNRLSAEIDRIVGQNMRRLREEARLGQREAATLLGISIQDLDRYEHGEERAPANVLLDFSRTVSCSLTDLFYGIHPEEEQEDFPGSRPSKSPLPQPNVGQAQPVTAPNDPPTLSLPDRQTAPTGSHNEALAVAEIMRVFGNLSDPVRQHLLGLLQAIYGTNGSAI